MACIRKRRGKWVVDYRDAASVRRWLTCQTKEEAEDLLAEKIPESRQRTRPAVDRNITVASYADRWLSLIRPAVKPRTLTMYQSYLRLHLLPEFGTTKMRHLARGHIKGFLAEKFCGGFSRASVQLMLATLHGMLTAAVEDGLILANPADRLGRQLRGRSAPRAQQEEIKAMTREQLSRFLAAASRVVPRFSALFLLFARTGARMGEAIALQWADTNFGERELQIARAIGAGGQIDSPKSGRGRTVDMSQELTNVLRRLQIERKREALGRGWPALPPWVFCAPTARPMRQQEVNLAFKRALKAAKLPLHFTPHCLRHTYASLLLQRGVSPVYVQHQLGHSSIKMTVDLYGRWLPMGNKAIADLLDGRGGSKVVAAEAQGSEFSITSEECVITHP